MDFNNNSWSDRPCQSGIKFYEERRSRRYFRLLGFVLSMIVSASLGGVIGGYYVKKNLPPAQNVFITSPDNEQDNLDMNIPTTSIPKNSVTKVAEAVGPAVVGIENNVTGWSGSDTVLGTGSGIIFSKEGYIVTNQHVIDGATKVNVILSGGRKVQAAIIGMDKKSDLAVLKIDVDNLPVAKFGDSSKVRVGELAIAIGNPMGIEYAGSVTVGVISAVNREILMDGRKYKVIQTDASINPGNSGGALLNEAGEVIGINSLKLGSAEGMGFAISINEAKPIIESIIKNGYYPRPFLGISYKFIDDNMSKEWKVPIGIGIMKVVSGSAADKGGIKANDIITKINGKELKKENDFGNELESYKIGETIKLSLWRNGKELEINVTLQDSKGQ